MVREQRVKKRSGRKRGERFEGEDECCIRRRGQIEQWRYARWRSSRRKSNLK